MLTPAFLFGAIVQMGLATWLISTGRVAFVLANATWIDVAVSPVAGAVLAIALGARPRTMTMPPLAVLVNVCAIGAAEEIIWRGAALAWLAHASNIVTAVIFTTVGFAVAHSMAQGWRGARVHLLTGATFGLVFIATQSVLLSIVAHIAYNLAVLATSNAGDLESASWTS